MHKSVIAIAGVSLLALSQPAAAFGGLVEAGELEHARANARAGGPVSERDAELLERHGCLSGTQNEFCEHLDRQRRHPNHRHRRHIGRY
jgi:hypothetical protein